MVFVYTQHLNTRVLQGSTQLSRAKYSQMFFFILEKLQRLAFEKNMFLDARLCSF